jgi:hypothetical protein
VLHGWHGVVAQAQVIHQCAESVPLEQTDTAAHQESEAVSDDGQTRLGTARN